MILKLDSNGIFEAESVKDAYIALSDYFRSLSEDDMPEVDIIEGRINLKVVDDEDADEDDYDDYDDEDEDFDQED